MKSWNLSANNENQPKCWNMSKKGEIEKWHSKLIKGDIFVAKIWIDQNVGTCLKNKEYWNFIAKLGIDQNVEIWVLIVEISVNLSMNQNVEIWVKRHQAMLKF